MKRTWKQTGSLFLTVCMVITMLPMIAFAYPGPVSGIMYIDGDTEGFDLSINAGEASRGWEWEAATATLTLTESYEGAPIEIKPSGDGDVIKLVYIGNVTITGTGVDRGLICQGNLIIDGSGGTLSVESSEIAINVTDNLIIEENASVAAISSGSYAILCQGRLDLRGSLNATCTVPSKNPIAIDMSLGSGDELGSVLVTNGNLTTNCKVAADMIVNDGTVNITGDLTGNLTVSAGQVTVTGQVEGGILNTGGTVWENGEQIFAPALFLDASTSGDNPFHLGEITGPSANLSGYTWDGTDKILTLSGLNYTSSGEAALRIVGSDVEIVLDDGSVNSINCANTTADSTCGISSNYNITFSGKGSLAATGGTSSLNSYGIYAEFRDIIIKGGTITATGGEANDTSHGKSYGIYASRDITVEGGAITATGGTSADSYGIYAGSRKPDMIVKSDAGTLTLPTDMLSNLDVAKDAKAEVKMVTVNPNNLTAEAQALVGGRPIVAINLLINGRVTGWNNPDAPVTVSIPYVPTAEELQNPGGITVYYIDSQGNLTEMAGAKYDPATKSVVFQTTHFSYYAVGYKRSVTKIQFGDVLPDAWYYNAVRFCLEKGITSGTSETTFSPNGTLTRGQLITMLLRAYGIDSISDPTDNFVDAGDTYYTGYLAAAKAKGIANGIGNNRFAPEEAITRQEMFTLLYNTLKSLNKLPTIDNDKTLADFTDSGRTLSDFADSDAIAPWATEAMSVLVEWGIVSGSGGKLDPTSGSTRAQMAQVLYNILDK